MISSLDKRKLKINSKLSLPTGRHLSILNWSIATIWQINLASYIEAQFTTYYSWQSLQQARALSKYSWLTYCDFFMAKVGIWISVYPCYIISGIFCGTEHWESFIWETELISKAYLSLHVDYTITHCSGGKKRKRKTYLSFQVPQLSQEVVINSEKVNGSAIIPTSQNFFGYIAHWRNKKIGMLVPYLIGLAFPRVQYCSHF